jgi:XTP/dITP diphosphohydrolase
MNHIVLASGNAGKVREFNQLLHGLALEVRPQSDYGVDEAIEDGLTFVENAIIKARNAARHTGLPAIADDSGLEVDYLNGAPGIYSARYAGEKAGDRANNEKLLHALAGLPEAERTARFQCLLVYLRHAEDPTPIICQGTWHGIITTAPHGDGGFGYDPLFFIPSQRCTAAQLPPMLKGELSHRGQALRQLLAHLSQPPPGARV